MKKAIYYASPLVMTPVMMLSFDWLDRAGLFQSSLMTLLLPISLLLFSAIMGSLSHTKKKFDCFITAIIPLSLFCALFIALFFDAGCDGTPQLSLSHATNVEYYRLWLPIAFTMAAVAFLASFKPIRIAAVLEKARQSKKAEGNA